LPVNKVKYPDFGFRYSFVFLQRNISLLTYFTVVELCQLAKFTHNWIFYACASVDYLHCFQKFYYNWISLSFF